MTAKCSAQRVFAVCGVSMHHLKSVHGQSAELCASDGMYVRIKRKSLFEIY